MNILLVRMLYKYFLRSCRYCDTTDAVLLRMLRFCGCYAAQMFYCYRCCAAADVVLLEMLCCCGCCTTWMLCRCKYCGTENIVCDAVNIVLSGCCAAANVVILCFCGCCATADWAAAGVVLRGCCAVADVVLQQVMCYCKYCGARILC